MAGLRIVCCPDSFKESMSAVDASAAMARGVRQVWPDADAVRLPLADGGEGTCATLIHALGGQLLDVPCLSAVADPIVGMVGYVPGEDLAIIEVASACGLEQVPPERRDAEIASSYGVGQLLAASLDLGVGRLVIGLGGTATNDAGAGMLSALGVRFLDASGATLPPGGSALARLASIDASGLDPRLSGVSVDVACDVSNPLTGPRGASAVFGPQKGATPEAVSRLDASLTRWADVVEASQEIEVRDIAGAGAGGGLGAAMVAFLGARLVPGVDLVLDTVGFDRALDDADLVLTGEGLVDEQSAAGKVPWGVALRARARGVPVVVFGGGVSDSVGLTIDEGIAALVPILSRLVDLPTALASGPANLERASAMVCSLIRLGLGVGRHQS